MSTHLKRLEPRHEAAHTESEEKTQKRRKAKALTLKEKDWEPYKKSIIDLHITQKMSLEKVRSVLATERGFIAETSQYRFRISKWGLDKKVKTEEMKAIVRRRQHRALLEPHKPELRFKVRGRVVDPEKIERWIRRHNVPENRLYAETPEAPTASDVSCCTISQRSSPVQGLATVVDLPSEPHLNDLSLHPPAEQQWLNNATSAQPFNIKSALQTEDLLWCLDTPWKHLLTGHDKDPEGSPLAALVRSLIEESRRADSVVSAITLARLLRGTGSKAEREWGPVEAISSTSGEIISSITWQLSVKRTRLGDPLDTTLVSVRMWVMGGLMRTPSRSLEMSIRWSAAGPHYTTGLAKLRVFSEGEKDDAIYEAIETSDTKEAEQLLSGDETALFKQDVMGDYPVSRSACLGDVEMTRVLIRFGSTVSNACGTHYNILWSIWEGFAHRSRGLRYHTESSPLFEDNFARCKVLTSLALEHGARIDECVHFVDVWGDLLHTMINCDDLRPAQWHQILHYLFQLGVNKDFRNYRGETPLLLAAGSKYNSEPMISALLSHNADISILDNAGNGYLHLALAQLAKSCRGKDEDIRQSSFLQWERRLAVLLKADPNAMTTINSAETPLYHIMDNELAWGIWSRVHTQLGWSMENSENIRSTRMGMARGNNIDYR